MTGDDIANWWTDVRQWASSDAGQDLSLALGTIGLATPLLAWFGGTVGGEYGALAGALIGTAAGLASTGIDCIAEVSSPSCIIGAVGSVAGGFGSSLAKSPKHLSVAAEASGKALTILGLNADVLGGIASWGDWWQRKNFGAG
ncbi:hypothetical protein ACFWGP_06125 [Agromyces sp. NPDC127015]|uniref:hypothetical protein n=1 Tax=Agromyces sp. NPDC127015 TaxID=3347108 RepID=UPI00366A290E